MAKGDNPFREDMERAAAKTDKKLAGQQAKLTTMSWDQLKQMLPSQVDQNDLDELMRVVNDATNHNERVAALIKNIGQLGGIIAKVLTKIP